MGDITAEIDALLQVDESQARVIAALGSGVQKNVNLAVAALLRDFSRLTPAQRKTVLTSLEDDIGKLLRNDELLARATLHVLREEDGFAAAAYQRMRGRA